MGMRPRGLGLRLRSRQLQPVLLALEGERCPFVATPFVIAEESFFDKEDSVGLASDKLLILRTLMGVLLFDRARLKSGLESSSSLSTLSSIFPGILIRFLVDERVTGPK